MRALLGRDWVDGLADGHRRRHEYRIQVDGLLNLEALAGLYPVWGRDARRVWNYLLEIGPTATARKVLSRTRERHRNAKFLSCGFGRVLEGPRGGLHRPGDPVIFLNPAGPACCERVVVPEEFLRAAETGALPPVAASAVAHLPARSGRGEAWWGPLRGWHAESGRTPSPQGLAVALKQAERELAESDWSRARSLPASGTAPTTELRPSRAARSAGKRRPRAVLFGYGNYAKTVALPHLRRHLEFDRIHELDPTQIPVRRPAGVVWDTSPELPDERYDAVIVAGYHHTHAPLAAEALARGAAVLVEKPVATTHLQLQRLLAAMRTSHAPIFSGYQRRYLPFNALAREDLGVSPGDPISYHAVVFEVPLPPLHWYRWPNSRSRLLSNGCHWLDHFLYLNDFAAVTDRQLVAAPDGQLNCSISLENGAFCTLALTYLGSRRLGVRDHVELRAGGVTVTIEDQSRYRAEDERRVLRRKRIPRLEAYRRMYEEIGRRIAQREAGDSLVSMQRSAELVLDLEDLLPGPVAREPEQRAPRTKPVRAIASA